MANSKGSFKFAAFDDKFAFQDEGFFTYSSTEQKRVEELCREKYKEVLAEELDGLVEGCGTAPVLHRSTHIHYACRSLKELAQACQQMDASRPWYCYWGMNTLRLLDAVVDESLTSDIVTFLKTCEWPTGGYGGGPGQYPHLATTYAAVMALTSIGTTEALASINRKTLYDFILSVKGKDGSFFMHIGGEVDVRGSYCALAVASITNIIDEKITANADSFIISCQTYEGGFGGFRGCEAHGGYTFCGVAALMILGKSALIHTESLFKWLSLKQMKFEGGFQGRTNKLVDVCYSFWQAAVFPMMQVELTKRLPDQISRPFDSKALQEYILVASQDGLKGGFRDKPEKARDLYHTCYALSGLSIAQSYTPDEVVGGSTNRLEHISPVYAIVKKSEQLARDYFSKLSKV